MSKDKKDAVEVQEAAPEKNFDELVICNNDDKFVVSISTNVIAQIIRKAVNGVDGVAHFAPKGLVDIISVFSSRAYDSSIDIAINDNNVSITLALILYYGCQVKEVCNEVQNQVKTQIEQLTSAKVDNVSIVVRDLVDPEVEEQEAVEEEEL